MQFIFANSLWWYFLFPILLNILFFIGGFYGIEVLTTTAKEWVSESLSPSNEPLFGIEFLKDTSPYFQKFVGGFIWLIFKLSFFFIFATFGGYLVIICLSPVFAILSEKTEEILDGKKYPFNPDQLMRDIVRGILIALRNVSIETFYLLLFFILGFIPLVGQFAAVLLFFISAYFYGFSFIDYSLERQHFSVTQSVQFMRKNKVVAIVNGSVFALIMLIPIIGITLAGFVSIIAVVAATISAQKIINQPINEV